MDDKINLELLLRDLYEAMSELSIVLDTEHDALAATDADKLQQAALMKEQLSDKVAHLDAQRVSILSKNRLENNLAGMQTLINQSSSQDENALFKLWNMVSEMAQDCTTKNKLNGIIIEAKRRQTSAALSVLQGYRPDSDELYDSDGTAVKTQPNSTIARA